MTRWGVFVWDADGDMGAAVVVGPFRDEAVADRKADTVRRVAERKGSQVQALVVPIEGGLSADKAVEEAWTER